MLNFFTALFRYRDAKSPDKLGLYPQAVYTKAMPERRYLWTSRFLVIFAAINICFTVILSLIIYILLPQRESSPILLQATPNSLIPSRPQRISIPPQVLQNEGFIRDYVIMRHSLPKSYIELNRMWAEKSLFYAYSTPDIWQEFNNSLDHKKMRQYLRKGYWRSIDISKVTNLIDNLYCVTFKTTTGIKDTDKIANSWWHAYLRISYQTYDDSNPPSWYSLNPFGFKVISYNLSYLGESKPQQNDFESSFSQSQE